MLPRLMLFLLLLATPLCGQRPIERALLLTREAAEAWQSGRHETAVEKLSEAETIYRGLPGRHEGVRAGLHRARLFNLVELGRMKEARADFEALIALRKLDLRVDRELRTAYGAFYGHAARNRSMAPIEAELRPLRDLALRNDLKALAAQVLHDLGTLRSRLVKGDEGFELLLAAAKERGALGDGAGQAWSLNNAGWDRLQRKEGARAFPLFADAFTILHRRGAAGPQTTVAGNLLRCIEGLRNVEGRRERAQRLWRVCEASAASSLPRILPVGKLALSALELDPSSQAAERLLRLRIRGDTANRRALLLAQAALLLPEPPPAEFNEAMDRLAAKDGLHPVLGAWLVIAKLRAAGQEGVLSEALAKRFSTALDALRDAGDRGALERAFELLDNARLNAEVDGAWTALVERGRAFRGTPRRRPLPGTSWFQPNADAAAAHPAGKPLFSLRILDGRLRITDEAARRSREIELSWQPRTVAFNGLRLEILGNAILRFGLRYGAEAKVPTSRTRADLSREFGALLIDDRPLSIFKNGGVF